MSWTLLFCLATGILQELYNTIPTEVYISRVPSRVGRTKGKEGPSSTLYATPLGRTIGLI